MVFKKILACLFLIVLLNPTSAFPSYAYRKEVKQKRQLQNCSNSQVIIGGICAENDIEMNQDLISTVTINKDIGYYAYYTIENDVITFLVEISTSTKYFGIGFGQSMTDQSDGPLDTYFISIDQDANTLEVIDSICRVEYTPDVDDTSDITLLGYEVGDTVKAKFSRQLQTGDNEDRQLEQGKKYKMMAVYSENSSADSDPHSLAETFLFEIVMDNNQDSEASGISTTKWHDWHTIGLFVAWGVVVDIPLILVRHFKTNRYYIWMHSMPFLFIDFMTWIVVIQKIDIGSDNLGGTDNSKRMLHMIFGFVFIILLFFQHFGGVAAKFMTEAKGGRKDIIGKIKTLHKFNGIFLYVLGKFLTIIGTIMHDESYDDDKTGLFVALCIVFTVLNIISAILFRLQNQKAQKYLLVPTQNKVAPPATENKELLSFINSGSKDIVNKFGKNFQYVMYGNRVVQLNNFLHAGGNYIITKVNGREVDRFIFGGYALEGDKRAQYLHSPIAEQYLIKNTVAFLSYPDEQNVVNWEKKNENQNLEWSINKIDQITPTTSKVEFKTEGVTFKNYLKGVEWFGRYFQVKKVGNDKRRLYTTIQCMTAENIEFRKNLAQFALNSFEGDQIQAMPEISQYLPLVIKKYSPNNITLSSMIMAGQNATFSVKGPQGTGLLLNQQSSGNHVIVTGGTGILPYLDLLNFLLQKVIYEIAKKEKGEDFAENNVDIHKIGLKDNFNDFKVILYSSFIQESEFLGRDIIEPLVQLCQKHNLDNFKFVAKFSKKCQIEGIQMANTSFNKNFFTEQSANWNNIQKVLVCGPPPMNSALPSALKGIVEDDKIHFV